MRVALGCDHAGFPLKEEVRALVHASGSTVIDCGTDSTDSVDYPDHAAAVARSVADGKADRGILICGSGVGACVAANKVTGVRACVCHDTYSAGQGVEHDDMNVLCLGGRIIGPAVLPDLVNAFLSAQFSGEERHQRRLDKVLQIERGEWPDSIPEARGE
ncbi:ribose 5-phosphate isomerase B [bacterium]|nr:MAG: ribose 5-phosphate isomerase B [bacterium]RKZ16482.1 MAG: ribose 5-phosphate isomerase B [bacterium]